MAALGAANEAFVVLLCAVSFEVSEDLIHPGTRDVHRDGGADRVSLAPEDVGELHALYGAVLEDQVLHVRVGNDGRALSRAEMAFSTATLSAYSTCAS